MNMNIDMNTNTNMNIDMNTNMNMNMSMNVSLTNPYFPKVTILCKCFQVCLGLLHKRNVDPSNGLEVSCSVTLSDSIIELGSDLIVH